MNDYDDIFKKLIDKGAKIASDGITFAFNNPEKTAAIFGGIIGLLKATKHLQVTHRGKVEQRRQERSWYDPYNHMKWDLKRRMTNEDRVYITTQHDNGVPIYKILKDRWLI